MIESDLSLKAAQSEPWPRSATHDRTFVGDGVVPVGRSRRAHAREKQESRCTYHFGITGGKMDLPSTQVMIGRLEGLQGDLTL